MDARPRTHRNAPRSVARRPTAIASARAARQSPWPFSMFEDATRGDRYAQLAAYRRNREMRAELKPIFARWLRNCVLAFLLMFPFDAPAAGLQPGLDFNFFVSAALGVYLAFGVCVLTVVGYVYLYLCWNDR